MDMFFLVTPMIGCMFYARLPPAFAAGLVAFGLAGLAILVVVRHDTRGGAYALGALATSSTFSLIALRELDGAFRRLYLVGLRQTLDMRDLAAENLSLDVLSTTDPLTGVGNRRHFEKALAARRFGRRGVPAARRHRSFQGNQRSAWPSRRRRLPARDGRGDAGVPADIRHARAPRRRRIAVLLTGYAAEDARRTADEIGRRVAEHVFEVDGAAHRVSVTLGAAEWDASRHRAPGRRRRRRALSSQAGGSRTRRLGARRRDFRPAARGLSGHARIGQRWERRRDAAAPTCVVAINARANAGGAARIRLARRARAIRRYCV